MVGGLLVAGAPKRPLMSLMPGAGPDKMKHFLIAKFDLSSTKSIFASKPRYSIVDNKETHCRWVSLSSPTTRYIWQVILGKISKIYLLMKHYLSMFVFGLTIHSIDYLPFQASELFVRINPQHMQFELTLSRLGYYSVMHKSHKIWSVRWLPSKPRTPRVNHVYRVTQEPLFAFTLLGTQVHFFLHEKEKALNLTGC